MTIQLEFIDNPQVIDFPLPVSDRTRLIVCTGVAVFTFTASAESTIGDSLSFNVQRNGGTDFSLGAEGIPSDDIVQVATIATLNGMDTANIDYVEWEVLDSSAIQVIDKIKLSALLRIKVNEGDEGKANIYRMAYQVTAVTRPHILNPEILVVGDSHLNVSDQEIAEDPTGAAVGFYQAFTRDIQTSASFNWNGPLTTGSPLTPNQRTTFITFDMTGAKVGQTRTHHVQVIATELGRGGASYTSPVFVVRVHVFHQPKGKGNGDGDSNGPIS